MMRHFYKNNTITLLKKLSKQSASGTNQNEKLIRISNFYTAGNSKENVLFGKGYSNILYFLKQKKINRLLLDLRTAFGKSFI
jgi:hypothetical protein